MLYGIRDWGGSDNFRVMLGESLCLFIDVGLVRGRSPVQLQMQLGTASLTACVFIINMLSPISKLTQPHQTMSQDTAFHFPNSTGNQHDSSLVTQ